MISLLIIPKVLIVAQYADRPMSKGWVVYNNATITSSVPAESSSAASIFSASWQLFYYSLPTAYMSKYFG